MDDLLPYLGVLRRRAAATMVWCGRCDDVAKGMKDWVKGRGKSEE